MFLNRHDTIVPCVSSEAVARETIRKSLIGRRENGRFSQEPPMVIVLPLYWEPSSVVTLAWACPFTSQVPAIV